MGGAMEPPAISFVTADPGAGGGTPSSDSKSVRIVVPWSRAYLAPLLAKVFEGRRDVEIVVRPQPDEAEPTQRPEAMKRPKEEAIEIEFRESVRAEAARGLITPRSGNGAGRA